LPSPADAGQLAHKEIIGDWLPAPHLNNQFLISNTGYECAVPGRLQVNRFSGPHDIVRIVKRHPGYTCHHPYPARFLWVLVDAMLGKG
jgi:hypothetical protein